MHNVHNCDFRYSNIANMFKTPPEVLIVCRYTETIHEGFVF